MNRAAAVIGVVIPLVMAGGVLAHAQSASQDRTGLAAYGDWRTDAPGVRRKITVNDLFSPASQHSVINPPHEIPRPQGAVLHVPPGFTVKSFAAGLKSPRVIRIAPNGDIFVAETEGDRVHVLRAEPGAQQPSQSQTFISGLNGPYGIAFYPPGPNPNYVYIATITAVLRFPYRNGDLVASGPPKTIVSLPAGGHTTRDLAFTPDGKTLFVSVGSASNVGEDLPPLKGTQLESFERSHVLGALWGPETDRADVLAFDPDGGHKRVVATGIRNCSGLTIQPETGALWCAVNERDEIGDDLPPDYVTTVTQGAFYGWPWYYIGDHQDPRLKGARPDLADKITVPDVLLQPHSAPLGITFYEATQFPDDYHGTAFVALHGSFNRAKRTGYKVVRLLFKDGKPTGEYEDFMTGFVSDDANLWGKPVDTAVAPDGSLLVTDNVGGKIWRISYSGGLKPSLAGSNKE